MDQINLCFHHPFHLYRTDDLERAYQLPNCNPFEMFTKVYVTPKSRIGNPIKYCHEHSSSISSSSASILPPQGCINSRALARSLGLFFRHTFLSLQLRWLRPKKWRIPAPRSAASLCWTGPCLSRFTHITGARQTGWMDGCQCDAIPRQ